MFLRKALLLWLSKTSDWSTKELNGQHPGRREKQVGLPGREEKQERRKKRGE